MFFLVSTKEMTQPCLIYLRVIYLVALWRLPRDPPPARCPALLRRQSRPTATATNRPTESFPLAQHHITPHHRL